MGKKNYELEIVISGGTDASLASSVQRAKREINSLEMQAGLVAKSIGDSFGGMSVKGIDALGKAADHTFGIIVKGGKMIAMGATAILGASATVGAGFESQMSTVQAISQATEKDMKMLNAIAKEMGETTVFSAKEAGQGLEYMAMAGWKTRDMVNGLPGIMYLAAASGEELGLVSDIVTDAMTAFGLSADQSAHFADVLAQASASSNTNVAMMGETFQYIAPVAGAFGYTIEDVALATGIMANAGIKSEKAGTAMRAMLTNLAKPTKQMRGYMDDLSISLVNGSDEMKPFRQQLEELRLGFSGLSEAKKAEYAAGIAGKEGMSGLLAIVTASDEDFKKLGMEIDNSTGAAERMSEVRMDNLAGDLVLMGSAAEGAGVEIYESMSENLRGLAQNATGWITSFTGEIREEIPTIKRQVKQFGTEVKEGFDPLMDFGAWCLENPDVVKGTLAGIAVAMGSFKAVQGMKAGIGLLSSLSGMMTAWPVAAFGLAAGAISGLVVAVKENNKRLKKEDMAKRFGSITLSMEELDETARMIVNDGNLGDMSEALEAMGKVKKLAGDFESASKKLDQLNWKIGMNFGLDDGDKEEYAATIEEMIKGSIDIAQQSQYTAQVSVQALFGTDSTTGNTLINGFGDMYTSINGEVQELGKQLGDVYSAAMEDGIIDIDEAATIQKLQQSLAEITQQVSQAQFEGKLDRITGQFSGKNLDPDTYKNVQAQIQEALVSQKEGMEQAAEATYANLNLQFQRGDISVEEYAEGKRATGNKLKEQTMLSDIKALNWSTQSITDAYSDVINREMPNIMKNFDMSMSDSLSTASSSGNLALALDPELVKRNLGLNNMDRAELDGITELWNETKSTYEQLSEQVMEYKAAGAEIPRQIAEGINRAETIGLMAGDINVISNMMGGSIAESPQFKEILLQAQEAGACIPETIASYINDNAVSAEKAVEQLGEETEQELNRRFHNMTVNGLVNIGLKGRIITPLNALIPRGSGGEKVSHYADGGLISRPTLSWFAEDSPEMAIPINGSRRSMELWQEAGELLGAYHANNYDAMSEDLIAGAAVENNSSSSFAPVYSPIINLDSGSGDVRGQARAALEESYERWAEFMERYAREKYRAAL